MRLTGGNLRNIEVRNNMQIKIIIVVLLVAIIGFMSAYTVETGNVAVERTLGKVNHEEQGQGLNFKLPFLTNSMEFSAKEIAIDINDLTPKAADNQSHKDLDESVFYQVPKDRISELFVKYASAAARGSDGVYMPAYGLLVREARAAIYEQVSQIDSLQLHKQRGLLQTDVLEELQRRLNNSDPGDIIITRVVVRALNTDPSIEAAIRDAVYRRHHGLVRSLYGIDHGGHQRLGMPRALIELTDIGASTKAASGSRENDGLHLLSRLKRRQLVEDRGAEDGRKRVHRRIVENHRRHRSAELALEKHLFSLLIQSVSPRIPDSLRARSL